MDDFTSDAPDRLYDCCECCDHGPGPGEAFRCVCGELHTDGHCMPCEGGCNDED